MEQSEGGLLVSGQKDGLFVDYLPFPLNPGDRFIGISSADRNRLIEEHEAPGPVRRYRPGEITSDEPIEPPKPIFVDTTSESAEAPEPPPPPDSLDAGGGS